MKRFISRSFYSFSKSLFDRSPYSFWGLYYFDVFIFLYGTPRLLMIYAVLNDPKKLSYFRYVDPEINVSVHFDSFIVIVLWLFDLFHITSMTLITRIDLNAANWRFWKDVIVHLQDRYYQCTLNQVELFKTQKINQEKLFQKIKQQLPLITCLVPKWIFQKIIKIGASAIVWWEMSNVNQDQFFSQQLYGLPNVSSKRKKRATLFMFLSDRQFYVLQIFIGKSLNLIF